MKREAQKQNPIHVSRQAHLKVSKVLDVMEIFAILGRKYLSLVDRPTSFDWVPSKFPFFTSANSLQRVSFLHSRSWSSFVWEAPVLWNCSSIRSKISNMRVQPQFWKRSSSSLSGIERFPKLEWILVPKCVQNNSLSKQGRSKVKHKQTVRIHYWTGTQIVFHKCSTACAELKLAACTLQKLNY